MFRKMMFALATVAALGTTGMTGAEARGLHGAFHGGAFHGGAFHGGYGGYGGYRGGGWGWVPYRRRVRSRPAGCRPLWRLRL